MKEGATFEFDLCVENLSKFELGALAWLLALPHGHFLRIGLGKPLGFGSVSVEVVEKGTFVADGTAWAATLASWGAGPPAALSLDAPKRAFEEAMDTANPKLLQAFLRAAEGFENRPVHYPRLAGQAPGDGQHFEWFVQNDKNTKVPLPDLTADSPALASNP